jgi:hypothetical protein
MPDVCRAKKSHPVERVGKDASHAERFEMP